MSGDVTLESAMAAAPSGSCRHLGSVVSQAPGDSRAIRIASTHVAAGRREVEGGRTVSVATVATVRTTFPPRVS